MYQHYYDTPPRTDRPDRNDRTTASALQRQSFSWRDSWVYVACAIAAAWFAWREPVTFGVFGSFGLAFWSLWKIADYFPFLRRNLGIKIDYKHVVLATLTMTMLFSGLEAPSYAIFLQGLEAYIKKTLTDSNSGIDPTAITLVFNAIRIIFLLLVAAAALFAFNQAQQGNDWRPIATQIGMAVGIVLVIDVITFIFIGGGAGGGAPGG